MCTRRRDLNLMIKSNHYALRSSGAISAVPVDTILSNFDPSGRPKRNAGAGGAHLLRYASVESIGSSSTGGVPCSSGVDEKSMSSPILSSSSGGLGFARRHSSGLLAGLESGGANISWKAHAAKGRDASFSDAIRLRAPGINYSTDSGSNSQTRLKRVKQQHVPRESRRAWLPPKTSLQDKGKAVHESQIQHRSPFLKWRQRIWI